MAGGFVTDCGLDENQKFLTCGPVARLVYQTMIRKCDDEGRGPAGALTWQKDAGLSVGGCSESMESIQAALEELSAVGLVEIYGNGKYLYLPGRFKHNAGRRHWAKSKFPLPPQDHLTQHPKYLEGLLELTSKNRRAINLGNGEQWRYPELTRPNSKPNQAGMENAGNGWKELEKEENVGNAAVVVVGVGVGVGAVAVKEGEEEAPPIFQQKNTRKNESEPGNRPATDRQVEMIQEIAAERGLSLKKEAQKIGLTLPPAAGDVSRLKAHLQARPKETSKAAELRERTTKVDQEWERVLQLVGNSTAVTALFHEMPDKGIRRAVLSRLENKYREIATREKRDWVADVLPAANDRRPGSPSYLTVESIPGVDRELGLGQSSQLTRPIGPVKAARVGQPTPSERLGQSPRAGKGDRKQTANAGAVI